MSCNSKMRAEYGTISSASLGVAGHSNNYSIIVVVGTKILTEGTQNKVEGE